MSDINKSYLSEQVQRTLKVITIMAGNEVNGISPGEIAKIAETSSSNITRILANLQYHRFAEPVPVDNSRFRLTAAFVQISNTVSLNIRQHQQQLLQDAHNYGLLSI